MGDLTISIKTGGLGRTSANVDKYVGLVACLKTLPAAVSAYDTLVLYKLQDLEDIDVKEDSTDDSHKALWYHVKEFFRLSPTGKVTMLFGVAGTFDVDDVEKLLQFDSKPRVIGYYIWGTALADTEVGLLNTKLEALVTNDKLPVRLIYSAEQSTFVALVNYPDFSATAYNRVMVDIAQDNTEGTLPATLLAATDKQCGAIGTILGLVSNNSVHQKISWVEKGNLSGAGEWQTLAFGNGVTAENISQTLVDDTLTKGLTFARKYPRSTNAYIAGSRMATVSTDDYAIINNGRVMDKAYGLVYDALLPDLDRPTYVKADGTLTTDSIEYLRNKAYNAIQDNMVAGKTGTDVELSVNETTGRINDDAVYIDPNQNVLTAETILVEIRLIPVGASKIINVEIGFINPNIQV